MSRGFTWGGAAGAVLVLLVAAVCLRLGFWQLERLEERRSRNAAQLRSLSLPPLELDGPVIDSVRRDPGAFLYRRIRIRGEPDAEREVIWRGRSLGGRPGVNLLMPVRPSGAETTVLVNRGWAPSPDAAHLDLSGLPEPAGGEVLGIAYPLPDLPDPAARPRTLESGGRSVLSLQRLDRSALEEHLGRPILPLVVQQLPAPGDPALPSRLPVPDTADEGPHLGYALQWFSFAAIALIGFSVVVALRSRSLST